MLSNIWTISVLDSNTGFLWNIFVGLIVIVLEKRCFLTLTAQWMEQSVENRSLLLVHENGICINSVGQDYGMNFLYRNHDGK